MNPVALITGASGGIGEEMARLLAAHRYDLVLVARGEQKLAALAAELTRAHGVQARVVAADLADPAAPAKILAAVRAENLAIEVLINNAGFGARGAYAEIPWETEAGMIQVNIAALAHLTRLFLPEMLARRKGRILNVGSTAAYFPGPFMAVYYATKAFVLSFSDALAEELAGTGVTVTTLVPGATATQFAATAGTENTPLFKSKNVMTAAEVARAGFDGMMAGKRAAIAGWRNQLNAFGSRLAPRAMLAKITRGMNN